MQAPPGQPPQGPPMQGGQPQLSPEKLQLLAMILGGAMGGQGGPPGQQAAMASPYPSQPPPGMMGGR